MCSVLGTIKVNKTATSVSNDSFSLICTATAEKYGLHSARTLPRLVVWKPKSSCLFSARLPLAEHIDFPRTDCNNNGHSFNHIAWHIAGDSLKTEGGRDRDLVEIECLALLFAYIGWMEVFQLSLRCWCHSLTSSGCSLPTQSDFCHHKKTSAGWHNFWHPFRRVFKTFCLLSPQELSARLRNDGLGIEGRSWSKSD